MQTNKKISSTDTVDSINHAPLSLNKWTENLVKRG